MTIIKTFDMQFIRYINLFRKVTRINAKHCFLYNNMIVFIVPRGKVEFAIGKDNYNLKRISSIIGKRIRVIEEPNDRRDLERFIRVLISPTEYQSLNFNDANQELAITAGRDSKALLIGRGRIRETEMKSILEQYFGVKTLKIL